MVSNGSNKTIILLGMPDEVVSIDMNYIDDREVVLILDFIHHIVWKELLSRSLYSMCDWSSRTNTIFLQYDLTLVGHVAVLSKSEVNRLHGCGYHTRKEIYEVCKSYGLILSNWVPGTYYEEKPRYVFKDG